MHFVFLLYANIVSSFIKCVVWKEYMRDIVGSDRKFDWGDGEVGDLREEIAWRSIKTHQGTKKNTIVSIKRQEENANKIDKARAIEHKANEK